MQKKIELTESYVGTSFAAKMLNLSVGTIQKLVKEGNLPAYLTTGGHRRIPYNAVLEFRQKNVTTAGSINICILHSANKNTENREHFEKIANDDSFQVIVNPAMLLKIHIQMTHIFMDARTEWIDWLQMEEPHNHTVYVIYNSKILTNSVKAHIEKFATLLDSDISIDFLYGYRMGLLSYASEKIVNRFPSMIRQ
jgi:excisionase family DNA binding protein